MASTATTPQRLYLMQVATIPELNIPVVCYLVQTSDGKNILIDSGLPEGPLPTLPGLPPPILARDVIAQLAQVGVEPDEVDIVVSTHYDRDHVGRFSSFPHAQLIAQRREYEDARAGNPRFAATRELWDLPPERYRFLEGDTELLLGFDLVSTPGHTAGHQSVLVRLPNTGPVLLTIDAVPTQQFFKPDRVATSVDADSAATIASTRKLLNLAERARVALVIFGHDGQQWSTLKKLPAYYD